VAALITGAYAPFHDREGRCTICGMRILEKSSPWLSQPILHATNTRLSINYVHSGLPDHEHNWEYMGGYMDTNFYGFPAEYVFDRTDPLLLVSDEYLLEIHRRLELLRALNCDDEYVRDTVRSNLYAHYPNRIGSFLAWWDAFMVERQGVVPCELLPGPPWETRQTSTVALEPADILVPVGADILNMN